MFCHVARKTKGGTISISPGRSAVRSAGVEFYLVGFNDLSVGGVKDVAVARSADGAFVKAHNVLRQRARLVGKDVLDLAQLLVECRRPGFGARLRLVVEHLLVPVDKERLGEPDDFDADVQRDGHDRVKHNGVREEDEQSDDRRAARRVGWDQRIPRQVIGEVAARHPFPDTAGDRAEQAHGQQEENNLRESRERERDVKT